MYGFLQKLLAAARSAFALMLGAGLAWTTLDIAPARADAVLLVDVESGKVISERNSTYPWYPASVTKLMTTYVTLRAVRDHRIDLDSLFTVSPHAVAQNPFKMGFKAGTQVTVDNALKMLLVHSPNDIAVVLAEGVSGSIEKFAEEMNAEAQRLGMTQTNYVNPNGLPADEQITSARDLAILARALIHDFPEYDYYWHIASIRLGQRVYRNTNRLIDAYAGADGMKTGFTCASGFNLVATATRGGKRLISVVLGAKSSTSRAVKAAQLFERGFATAPPDGMTPSPGTVEELEPVTATPPDMYDDVCGNRRHRPTKDAEEGGEAATAPRGGTTNHGERHVAPRSSPPAVLTSGLAAAIAPVEVYTGPVRNGITSDASVAPATATKARAAEPRASKRPSPLRHQHTSRPRHDSRRETIERLPDDFDAPALERGRKVMYAQRPGFREPRNPTQAVISTRKVSFAPKPSAKRPERISP